MEETTANPIAYPSAVNPSTPSPETSHKKPNFNKSVILVVVLVALTGILLAISLTAKKSSLLPSENTTQKSDVAHTTLAISDQPEATSVAGAYQTNVNIDTQDNKVTGVQLSISFDPKALTNVDIKSGTFLTNATVLQKTVDTQNGVITFVVGTSQGSKGVSGKGDVAVISFSKISSADATLEFLPDTLVTAEGYDQSVLKETTSATLTGIGPSGSSSATTTP